VGARLTLSSSEVSGAIGGALFLAMIFVVMFTVHTIIENVNITVPVVDPAPVVTPTSLNAAILTQ
jgi:hypothetical protein